MTIPTETSRMDYVGNGATTVYPYTFKIDDETELLVVTADTNGAETTLVLNTDYTVSGVGSQSGGNVTLTTVLTSGYALTIQVQTDITQETDIKNQGAFSPEVIEDAFDHNIRVSQMINNSIGRAVRLPLTATGIDTNLANLAPGQFIRLSDAGTQLEGAQAFATLSDATQDGNTYGRKDGAWVEAVPDGSITEAKLGLAGSLGWRNKLINGDFRIDQRNSGSAVVVPSGAAYSVDRWRTYATQASKLTAQRAAGPTATTGDTFSFFSSIYSSAGGYSPISTDQFFHDQIIEGDNATDLNGRSVAVSFWVNSEVAGTYGIHLSVGTRSILKTYTVNSASFWEKKTVLFPVDSAPGTAPVGSGIGARLLFDLGSGSTFEGPADTWANTAGGQYFRTAACVKLVAQNAKIIRFTGVQLEVGDTATQFEHRPNSVELAMCQRYYERMVVGTIFTSGGASYYGGTTVPFRVTKRAAPTMGVVSTSIATNVASSVFDNVTSEGARYYVTATGAGPCSSSIVAEAAIEI